MHISRIKIHNIRCFKEEVKINLQSDGEINKCLLILGDNSTGKTTVLRSIAMGLCEEPDAITLSSELYGELIRDGEDEAVIEISLKDDKTNEELVTKTIIKDSESGFKITKQPEKFPWESIFACGYGAARHKYESADHSEYYTMESVYSLFNYKAPLQNPELMLYRLNYQDDTIDVEKDIFPMIENILMLPEGSIRFTIKGLEIKGPWGTFMPIGSVGDGYQATLSWIVDMLGWAMFKDKLMLKGDLTGIVLIDEIEQHMHPTWQKRILGLLKKQFPKLQFIITSHSPLCAIGTTELNDRDCQLMLLKHIDDYVEAVPNLNPPRGRRADQVLTSYLFGMTTASDDKTKHEVERYAYLASRQRSEEEETEFLRISEVLDKKLGTGETELEQIVAAAVHEILIKTPKAEGFSTNSLNYEIRRQLIKLLRE